MGNIVQSLKLLNSQVLGKPETLAEMENIEKQ
jgi:hypothetical protein